MRVGVRYLLKRAGLSLLSVYAVATILFLLTHLSPGDPSTVVVSPTMTAEARQRIIEQYGLNDPLHVQYVKYITSLLTGNLGISFMRKQAVLPLVVDTALNTMVLMVTAVLIAFIVGPLIGALFAWFRGTRFDSIGIAAVLFMWATPIFWTGMVAIMVFSFQLGWLPSSGMHSAGYVSESLADRFLSVDFLEHLLLPLTVTTLYWLTAPTFVMRNNMIDVLGSDHIELNRAQGLSDLSILYKHAARNALLPVMHFGALAVGLAFGGSVLIEAVFSWPGLGRLMWQAVLNQDYPLAQGGFLGVAVLVIVMNFAVDVLSVYIDPRVAEGE